MYSALSGKYVNATTGNACKSNEINSRNVAGPVTPHQNSLRHLGIIHAQLPPHTFPSYLTRQRSRSNYFGLYKCTINWNDVWIRTRHKIWSTSVPRQRQHGGIHVHWWHRHLGRMFNKYLTNYWRFINYHAERHCQMVMRNKCHRSIHKTR